MILSVRELAVKYNLTAIGPCNCGGYRTEKFSNGTYTLSWRTSKCLFSMKKRNEMIKGWTAVNKLAEYLEILFK